MKEFYYKFEKTIKIITFTFIASIILVVPVLLLFITHDKESYNVGEVTDPNPVLQIRQEKKGKNFKGENISNFDIQVNTDGYKKEWEVVDYYLVLSEKQEFDYIDFNSGEYVWTPVYSNNKDVKESLLFDSVSKTDDIEDYLVDSINSSKQFVNDATPEIKRMSETDNRLYVYVGMEFKNFKYATPNEIVYLDDKSIKVASDEILDGSIQITLNDLEIENYNSKKRLFDEFLINSNGISRADNLRNEISPKLDVSNIRPEIEYADESFDPLTDINYDDIFKVKPKVNFELYASNDNNSVVDLTTDVKIYEGSSYYDFTSDKNYIETKPKKITKFDDKQLYNENNEIMFTTLKVVGNLEWEYYNDEVIKTNISESNDIDYEDITIINNTTTLSGDIEFGSLENSAKTSDDKFFYEVFYSDKSDFPEFFIHPNWDAQGNFNVLVATDDKYTFETTKSFNEINNITMHMWLTESISGSKFKMEFKFTEFKKVEFEGNNIFYSNFYPLHNISPEKKYYINYSKKKLDEIYLDNIDGNGIVIRDFRTGSASYDSLYSDEYEVNINEFDSSMQYSRGRSRSYSFENSFIVYEYDEEIVLDEENDKFIVLLPENISKNMTTEYKDSSLVLYIIFLVIASILPIIFLVYVFFKKNNS